MTNLYFAVHIIVVCFIPFTGEDELNKLAFSQCVGLHSSIS